VIGKSFAGRLGDIDTRVATINQAANLERSGLLPVFEYPVPLGTNATAARSTRYVDLVGVDPGTGQARQFFQFVKENTRGTVIRADELAAARQIERTLNLQPGTVQLINTAR
jgi:hypothetical protein